MDELEKLKEEVGTYKRLDQFIARVEEEGDCWLWRGSIQNNVPMLFVGGNPRYIQARRFIMDVMGIKPKQAMAFLGVTCGNPECVKPGHIKQRTVKEHMRHAANMTNKGSNELMRRYKIRQSKRRLGLTKLTDELVREIVASDESGPVLAKRYGVNTTLINRVKRGEAWRMQEVEAHLLDCYRKSLEDKNI